VQVSKVIGEPRLLTVGGVFPDSGRETLDRSSCRCFGAARAWSGGELAGGSGVVFGSGEAVDHEGPADQVEVLPTPTDRVGSSEVEGVFEAAVDGFGVCA